MSKPSTPISSPRISHSRDSILPNSSTTTTTTTTDDSNILINDQSIKSKTTSNKRHSTNSSQLTNKPSTPSPPNKKRHSNQFLKTPEQSKDSGLKRNSISLPYTPSYKRTSSGSYKSPDGKLIYHNVNSPYSAAHLLKTPRHSFIDNEENEENDEGHKLKMMKTPQYLNTAKRLFQNDNTNEISPKREDLNEISSTLKNRLSSALGKLQKEESNNSKISFTELSFDSQTSPTKKYHTTKKNNMTLNNWTPTNSLNRANLNLQTLQQSPISNTNLSLSPNIDQHYKFKNSSTTNQNSDSNSPLRNSPILKERDETFARLNDMPSPDDENSAHNALLATLSRQKKSRLSFNGGDNNNNSHSQQLHQPPNFQLVKLPPIDVAAPIDAAAATLISLSSPRTIKHQHNHSKNQSINGTNKSPSSSRSSSVQLLSPTFNTNLQQHQQQQQTLPPFSRLVNDGKMNVKRGGVVFSDETDDEIEDNDDMMDDNDNDSDRTVDEDK
ncbi:hypothetical protein KGF54_003910 [Candida jiufengensis]|uniref:uncharacterized protein n=1 Tax=Candida jiufengensis TaxID=497108 RepID=UPI0022259255|nr:uncharacterized protein KGF54_003910 [Candida jiufengensis]KAI5950836.1 hypothetical protein KGF54_003910 [Candida jiufengensis]